MTRDRHHRRQLATPTETRNCLAYIVMNHRKHAAERNWHVSKTGALDRYSSGEWFDGWSRSPGSSATEPVVHDPGEHSGTWATLVVFQAYEEGARGASSLAMTNVIGA